MSRKVLISFVGTGHRDKSKDKSEREYSVVKYQLGEQCIETSFVSIALGEMLDIDTYFLFGTMRSMWEEVYANFIEKEKFNEDYWIELSEKCGDNTNHKTKIEKDLFQEIENAIGNDSKIIPIHYGINDEEIKQNFSIFVEAMNHLQDGDEIYLDITHAFRSLPLFANTAISFIKDVSNKKIEFKGIYYGMFEVSKEMGGVVPIVNLSYINEMQNWIKGAYSFTHFGNGQLLSELLKDRNKTISTKLKEFTESLSMNYIDELKTQISALIPLTKEENYELPERLILPKAFKDFVDYFKGKKELSEYQYTFAKWHNENHNYALSYLCLTEAIVSFICEKELEKYGQSPSRDDAKNILFKNYSDFASVYRRVNDRRKKTAHSINSQGGKITSKKAVEELNKDIKELEKLFKDAH